MKKYEFPSNFTWGVAAGSYQIEGGWNEGGKGESIWDRFCHTPGHIKDGTTGDVACDFYHTYEDDIRMMKKLGYPNFLFSISWPRVIPDGIGIVNQAGIEFYRNVLTCLRENGIKSYVVLYHWDLPQKLQERGGWMNREIIGWFDNYARTMYRELGDLVDNWITVLEPWVISFLGHGFGVHAPGYQDYSSALTVAHHVNLAHGTAVKAFRESGLSGNIGIKVNMSMIYPEDPNSAADIAAANRQNAEMNTLFCDPIFKGTYPQEYFDYLVKQGVILPDIRPGDMELICQDIDFFGLNNYNGTYVKDGGRWPLYASGVNTGKPVTQNGWEYEPKCFYDLLKSINDTYHPKNIIITENGCASNDWVDDDGTVTDPIRLIYLRNYLKMLHKALGEGIPIKGYFVWSLWDNFEWAEGLSIRFGIIHVDYNTLKRTPKASANWYSNVIRNNGFESL
ncbi:beta-glucosidase [Anaerocolumna sedimenticola]|uniref:Beta-glucosidase n=2 Tax=Anaerocolumna sedimenticola TaxID=2696063 RepID=A0A6P1TV69_9FIRM|nr:beta-glucosidase [Anaerocolumna sedimenticola]